MTLAQLHRSLSKRYNKFQRILVKQRYVLPYIDSIPEDAKILEIGGGYNPRFMKGKYRNVYHLDHCTTDELRAKYAAMPEVTNQVDRIQEVDFVFSGSPIETLVPPDLRFDVIYGSHVLEHQVDLVGHLQSIESLLAPGGRVVHIIPDFRCCFDALRYPSVTSDVLLAHLHQAPVHQGKQVFDFFARYLTVNLGRRVMKADLEHAKLGHRVQEAYAAMVAAEDPAAEYKDIHAWVFRPESFRLIMIELQLLGLTRLVPRVVSPTYDNQFCAVLERAEVDPAALPQQTVDALERERLLLCKQLRM